jgi:hypothetical protein
MHKYTGALKMLQGSAMEKMKWALIIFVTIPLFSISFLQFCSNGSYSLVDEWPMFQHDPSHSGYSTGPAPIGVTQLWNYTTGEGGGSSIVVIGGEVFGYSSDNNVYCFDAFSGAKIWNYTANAALVYYPPGPPQIYGGGITSSPAVVDGKVYIGSGDNNVYCLNAFTGDKIWNYSTGPLGALPGGYPIELSSPAVAKGYV